MKAIKIITLSLFVTALAGCSGLSGRQAVLTPTEPAREAPSGNTDVKLLPKEIIPSSTNSCIDDMALLKQTSYSAYQDRVRQYGELMNEYHFLRRNSEIMDKDTKQYLSDILEVKRDTLCSKIKFNVFQSIKKKTAELTAI
ncbi:hypothetical protein X965_14660 [Morganella sp. EGD-HP17]|nr:hypothetical protein X965_14660 [Morganella sp. EGD-HP17]